MALPNTTPSGAHTAAILRSAQQQEQIQRCGGRRSCLAATVPLELELELELE